MKRRRLATVALALVLGAGGLAAFIHWLLTPALETLVHGGQGPTTLVLLHGYGSSAEHWVPFTQTIRLPPGGRFVFPQAPDMTTPPDGPADGRGWWKLELAAHIPVGGTIPDLSRARPEGLPVAASRVERLLRELREPGAQFVLGGFSQGAMVAAQVAFLSDARIVALVLLSGTLVDESTWERNFWRRQGLPVFISHGRADQILPFQVALRFRLKLQAAGLRVTWHPFEGGHQIPAEVVIALNRFIQELGLRGAGNPRGE